MQAASCSTFACGRAAASISKTSSAGGRVSAYGWSPYRRQPCQQGVNSAGVIKATGTLVYTIGYDLDALGGGANVCRSYTGSLESPAITAYDALRLMATNSSTFFNRPNPGDLTAVYTQIAAEIGGTRLIPDDTL